MKNLSKMRREMSLLGLTISWRETTNYERADERRVRKITAALNVICTKITMIQLSTIPYLR
jgi:hypothetical protein